MRAASAIGKTDIPADFGKRWVETLRGSGTWKATHTTGNSLISMINEIRSERGSSLSLCLSERAHGCRNSQ